MVNSLNPNRRGDPRRILGPNPGYSGSVVVHSDSFTQDDLDRMYDEAMAWEPPPPGMPGAPAPGMPTAGAPQAEPRA